MTVRPAHAFVLLVALFAWAIPAQAAEQPEAPGDFRNAQENAFGSIAMEPYVSAGEGSVPIEASIVLRDLDALGQAHDVLFAFNVKGDAVRATLETLRTADGQVLVPVQTATVDHGRQPQAHFEPAALLAVAREGRIDLVLSGRVEAKADSQSHVGAMVIAFDEGWGTVPSGDGSAQLYGFTMVSSLGLGGGLMPFHGQGNTWAMLPLALLALVVALAGAMAVSVLAGMPPKPASTSALAPSPAPTPVAPPPSLPTFGQPARPAAPVASVTAAPSSAPVPVFGGPASPALGRPLATPRAPLHAGPSPPSPLQGPLLPPHPLDRSPMSGTAAPRPAAALPASPVAEARVTLPARLPPAGRPAHVRPAPRPAPGAVLTATKRPKAKPRADKAGTPAAPSRRPAPRKRVAAEASR